MRTRFYTVVLYLEGPSDDRFLPVVVRKSIDDLLRTRFDAPAEADVQAHLVDNGETPRPRWIVEAAERDHARATLVALHFDATADLERERKKYFDPVDALWSYDHAMPALVPLAPQQEIEAWALADLDAVRGVVGGRLDPSVAFEAHLLGTPERLSTPKRTLEDLISQARRPRRPALAARDYLPLIAERLDLEPLRKLSSFRAFEASITAVLT